MADEYEELLHGYEFFIGLMKNHGKSVDEAISQVKNMFKGSLGDRIVEYWQELVIRAADPSAGVALIKGVGAAEAWYPGPRANDVYWSSLRDHLLHHPTHPWTQSDVDDLDDASNVVLASCRSPWTETSSGRGLVVGHVQSGKTRISPPSWPRQQMLASVSSSSFPAPRNPCADKLKFGSNSNSPT